MPVGANAAEEQIHAAGSLHAGFVGSTFSFQVFSIAVEDVYILRLDVDVAEEVVPHERMIAFGMFFRQADVFIHIERDDVLERYHALLVQLNQVFVHTQRG